MRSFLAPSAALLCLFLAGLAQAETPAPAPAASTPAPAAAASSATPATATAPSGPVVSPADVKEPVLEPIPSAHDTLSGHFVLGAAAGAKWGFGSFDSVTKESSVTGTGLALNLDLGFGLSRNVVLGAWGEYDTFAAPSGCSACSVQSVAGGPFLRYHLVQGTRFDPWGALAVGLRGATVNTGSATHHYAGVDWLRLTLGGDWYPWSNLAVGPYVEFDVGSYGKHPQSGTVDTTGHTGLGTGLRLTLDFPGK